MLSSILRPCALLGLLVSVHELKGTVGFTRGPFVQNATTESIQIIWRTATPSSTFVEYGLTPGLGAMITNAALVTNHVAALTGLVPGTRYHYRVGSAAPGGTTQSGIEWFRTLKTEGAIEAVVVGDTARGTSDGAHVAARMLRERDRAEMALHLGDIVYYGIYHETNIQLEYFNPYQPLIKHVPFYMIAGNHDLDGSKENARDDLGGLAYQATFYLPTNSATGDELFYSFDHGDAHFVCLFNPWYLAYIFTNGSVQYAWLTNDLARSRKPWKFLLTHYPPANVGLHANRDYSSNGVPDQTEVMNLLLPPARAYGVQMIFASHDHNYQKFAPTNGVHHLISGGGGRGIYTISTQHVAMAQFWPVYHYLNFSLAGDTLRLEAVDTNGVIFDQVTVTKALPARQVFQAAWNTPVIEAAAANDSDGNVNGQQFDFVGNPIYPRAGQFSNLGQVRVNNDATNLYVGLNQVLLYPGNNVFLFIASPRLAGVTTMSGVGNGLVDPAGQGADGLDCLENLSFTAFQPAIGCLLGDEYGDGQFRSFSRSGLGLNIGQGVYRLDASLAGVPGVRLQQYNRSPQTNTTYLFNNGVTLEQNADFIELAIPLSELGGVRPGETIQLGAVTGGGWFDAGTQRRWLDTAALGYALEGSGSNTVRLEGVSVRLAVDPALPRLVIQSLGGGVFRLAWNAQVGRRYDIEYSADLAGFTSIALPGLPLTATSTNAFFDLTPPPDAGGFYRLRIVE